LLLLLLSIFLHTEEAFTEKTSDFGRTPTSVIYSSLAKKFKTYFIQQRKKSCAKKIIVLSQTDLMYASIIRKSPSFV
jgi:hypothetical protein